MSDINEIDVTLSSPWFGPEEDLQKYLRARKRRGISAAIHRFLFLLLCVAAVGLLAPAVVLTPIIWAISGKNILLVGQGILHRQIDRLPQ